MPLWLASSSLSRFKTIQITPTIPTQPQLKTLARLGRVTSRQVALHNVGANYLQLQHSVMS